MEQKRKASTTKVSGEKIRASKKKRLQIEEGEAYISPTVIAWVGGFGVVLLVGVGVIGFALGRQYEREMVGSFNGSLGASGMGDGAGCGREAVRGSVRRFRWGIGASAKGVVA